MNWSFPLNHRGQEHGFHDPGVETFKGNFDRYLARESIQNSIDAASEKLVTVEFNLFFVKGSEVPGTSELSARFKACEEYWTDDAKAKKFFRDGQSQLKGDNVSVLRISDFSTTGVTGGDAERKGNWYNLVRCSGSSFKAAGEGGSFGIGKNAPFAASALRTVFYSTLNEKKEHIFQGVARLATHNSPDQGETSQHIGYYGLPNGDSIRNEDEIPKELLRTKQGTDILIYGYLGGANWRDDIIYSVLENFWPAIHFGKLIVKVNELEINQQTLPSLIKKYSDNTELSASFYFNAITAPGNRFFQTKLAHLGDVNLWLFVGDSTYRNKIAMARKPGMVVFTKAFRSILRFSGFFHCDNDEGNRMLREMEPPAHDAWDPDRPEKNKNKKVEKELYDWLRACVRELAPHIESKVINIPDLYRYLPDDGEEEDTVSFGEPTANTGGPIEESAKMVPKPVVLRPMTPKKSKERHEDDEGEDPGGADKGGEKPTSKQKTQQKGQGEKSGKDEPEEKLLDVSFRSFLKNPQENIYRITVKPKVDAEQAKLYIKAVGDDSRAESVKISQATLIPEGTSLKIEPPNIITEVMLCIGKSFSIEVKVSDKLRYALEVVAYEI